MTESRYRWFLAMARVAQADGDPDEAVNLLDRAEQLYRPGFFLDVRPIAAMKTRIKIAHGKLADAADWAQERGVSTTDDASYLREFDHLTLVRLLLAQHRVQPDTVAIDQAASLLGRLLASAATSGRAGSLLEIRILQALAHDAQGHRPRGPGVPCPSRGAGPRTPGVRPALPGRGRAHGGAADRRRAPGHRW